MQTLKVIATDNHMILTSDYKFLSATLDSPLVTDIDTGEMFEILGCTTNAHGQLESIDLD